MIRALAVVFAFAPVVASAGQFEVFSARCLDPFEHLTPPVIDGLTAMERGAGYSAYPLPEGFVLVYETQPEDAEAACSVIGRYVRGEALRFEIWALEQAEQGRYAESGEGRWLSTTWVEPKVALELTATAESLTMRVVETDLES
ncbi:hypothetical protein [Pseudaestuariivita sp.]|uniref:hypothetical protein n=1 Tax=Pseudaestuariivita sp. TaxID=2211669 RepID=UPI004059144F